MLRIHFTRADLARTYVAEKPDPLWEIVFSLQMLTARYGRLTFADWRRQTRGDLRKHGSSDMVRTMLAPLVPDASYFPDFLTPPEGLLGLGEGVEAVISTSRSRIRREVGILRERSGAPPWARELAEGTPEARAALGRMLDRYFRHAIEPVWPKMTETIAVDRATRAKAQREGGVERLLQHLNSGTRWRPPVLEIGRHPVNRDLHLEGRGLLLIPSYFCWSRPVPLADPNLLPTLLYPVRRELHWPGHPSRPPNAAANPTLDRLLGSTRAAILRATVACPNTTDIAGRLGVSPAAVSQHTAILRDAGLITSRRHANNVFHIATPLGTEILKRDG